MTRVSCCVCDFEFELGGTTYGKMTDDGCEPLCFDCSLLSNNQIQRRLRRKDAGHVKN